MMLAETMKTWIFSTLFSSILIFLISCSGRVQDVEMEDVQILAETTELKAKDVCMVDNKLMDTLLLSTEIGGKTYYGCCEPCIEYLTSDESIRFAKDPLTNKQVDKSEAYIALNHGKKKDIMYFESEQSFKKYIDKQKKD